MYIGILFLIDEKSQIQFLQILYFLRILILEENSLI